MRRRRPIVKKGLRIFDMALGKHVPRPGLARMALRAVIKTWFKYLTKKRAAAKAARARAKTARGNN